MEGTKQTPRKKAYDAEYRRGNMKRIPLEMKNEQYDTLKAAADSVGMAVNAFIKSAIREKMEHTAPPTVSGTPDSDTADGA